jgi:hypothetical protein
VSSSVKPQLSGSMMNYLDEFKQIRDELILDQEKLDQLYKAHFKGIMRSLDRLIELIENDPRNYEKIDGINLGFHYKLSEIRPFTESLPGRDLLILLNSYTEFVMGKIRNLDLNSK